MLNGLEKYKNKELHRLKLVLLGKVKDIEGL